MVSRLVLGLSSVGHDVLDAVPRSGSLTVVTADRSRVDALRDGDVDAREGDPADPGTYPETADVVLVAGETAERNLAAARQARESFPDALLVAYVGADAAESAVADIEAVADRIVDPTAVVARRAVDAVAGPASERTRRLRRVLASLTEPLAVVTHDNPDPDAIASALALARIAESVGVDADACYYGEISHQENRALVNLLDISLVHLDEDDLAAYGSVALVDHSRPGVNDSLPEDTPVDVVIDHHPPRAPVEGGFVDLRSDVGATSTLLCEYLDRFDVTPSEQVASALLYGIRVDTRDFTREVSETDFEAAAFLLPHVDTGTLDRIEEPSISVETMETLARAVDRREVRDGALATGVGEIRDRDALAQAAESLLNMEGVHVSIVYGFMNDTVYVSGRTRGADIDLGETFRDAFGRIGSAGGHADMAGAQIPLGILADVDDDSKETLSHVVTDIVNERFYTALSSAPSAPQPDSELTYEYSAAEAASMVPAEMADGEHGTEADEESVGPGDDEEGDEDSVGPGDDEEGDAVPAGDEP